MKSKFFFRVCENFDVGRLWSPDRQNVLQEAHPSPPPQKKPHCMSTLLLGCPTIQEIRCFVLKKEKQSQTKRKYFRPLLKRNCPRNHFCMKNRFACKSVFCSDFHFESDKINPLSRTVVVFRIPV